MRRRMPISRWLKWRAWARSQGPLGTLAEDYRAADLALRTSISYTPEDKRTIAHFLPLWRKPSDYLAWGIDLGPDPGPEEYVVD